MSTPPGMGAKTADEVEDEALEQEEGGEEGEVGDEEREGGEFGMQSASAAASDLHASKARLIARMSLFICV